MLLTSGRSLATCTTGESHGVRSGAKFPISRTVISMSGWYLLLCFLPFVILDLHITPSVRRATSVEQLDRSACFRIRTSSHEQKLLAH